MPRIARVVSIREPHHITQRGNNKQIVFRDDSDKQQYLIWLLSYSKEHQLDILSYCLMTNHLHLLVVPFESDAIAKTLRVTHSKYSQFYNKKYKMSGHLWQNRFYSSVVDSEYIPAVGVYIENNPVRARISERSWDYEWSSAKHNALGIYNTIINGCIFDYCCVKAGCWRKELEADLGQDKIAVIRKNTQLGYPLCNDEKMQEYRLMTGQKLKCGGRGRPKKVSVPI